MIFQVRLRGGLSPMAFMTFSTTRRMSTSGNRQIPRSLLSITWQTGVEPNCVNAFRNATHLLLLADGGGSNASRSRVFKHDLQEKIADAFGLSVTVGHYPP